MTIKELKLEKRYEEIFTITKEELEAIELLALQDGEIYQPLFVWKGQKVLVYGYHYVEILKAHPDIKYTIRQRKFQDWQEAQAWAVEHYIAQPEVRLWQKLEAAIMCENYWLLKAKAKKAKGKRKNQRSPGERNSDSAEADVIIGKKVGCGKTYVSYFKKVYNSDKKDLIEQCRQGELSIKKAWERLTTNKKSTKSPRHQPKLNAPIELDVDGSDVFDECEYNIDVGKKNIRVFNGTPIDPLPIAQKIKTTQVPDGAVWVVLNKKEGQMQVVKKSLNEQSGNIRIKANTYNYHVISADDDVVVLEADHINGATERIVQKDNSELDGLSKTGS